MCLGWVSSFYVGFHTCQVGSTAETAFSDDEGRRPNVAAQGHCNFNNSLEYINSCVFFRLMVHVLQA